MGDNDLALVRTARAGDRGAFGELVRRTSRLVYARLYLETGDAHRAEDLLQETYLSAFRSLHRPRTQCGNCRTSRWLPRPLPRKCVCGR